MSELLRGTALGLALGGVIFLPPLDTALAKNRVGGGTQASAPSHSSQSRQERPNGSLIGPRGNRIKCEMKKCEGK